MAFHGASPHFYESPEVVEEFGRDGGLIHEVVVAGRKQGIGKKFWAYLAHSPEVFEAVIQFVNEGRARPCIEYRRAIGLLESVNSIDAQQAGYCWLEKPQNYGVHYTKATLDVCMVENAQGKADWRLVYLFNLSLSNIVKKLEPGSVHYVPFGLVLERPPLGDWSHGAKPEGYYLINFKPQFLGCNWSAKVEEMEKLDGRFFWPNPASIAQAIMSAGTIPGADPTQVGRPEKKLLLRHGAHVAYDGNFVSITRWLDEKSVQWSPIEKDDDLASSAGVCIGLRWE